MNAEVIRIRERSHERPMRLATATGPDIERAQRALGSSFAALKPRGVLGDVERFLARDARGAIVELRVLSARAASDAKSRDSFYGEARAASRLAHVNIAATMKAEQIGGADFCVVEHKQQARTLREMLDNNGWFEVKIAADIADQIASALDYAHQIGVLHLQLQPECVLIEPDGWVTITDFGIESSRGEGCWRLPRVPYASPEQTAGLVTGHRADLYALGAVLYEMLTDRTPFDSNDSDYVKQKQVAFRPAPPHLIYRDVPEALSNVVMKLLEREPEKRFSSASAFQAALNTAANQG